jgi:hypothetical protein
MRTGREGMEMADGDHQNHIDGDHLWDADGNEWIRHVRWVTLAQARSFVRRGGPVGLIDAEFTVEALDGGLSRLLHWLDASQAQR